ncbi:MAG: hypothetical protein ACOC2U_00110 [bacterium]
MKKKVYIDMDSTSGEITINSKEVWKINVFDWIKYEQILLTEQQQLEAQDTDFWGYVPYDKYLKAKTLYDGNSDSNN